MKWHGGAFPSPRLAGDVVGEVSVTRVGLLSSFS
jgi:hypothetical protein